MKQLNTPKALAVLVLTAQLWVAQPVFARANDLERHLPDPDPQGTNLAYMAAQQRLRLIEGSERMLATTANAMFIGGTPSVDIVQATVQAQRGGAMVACGRARFWFPGDERPMPLANFIIHTAHGVAIRAPEDVVLRWCGSYHARLV